MKERLKSAYDSVLRKDIPSVADVVAMLKELPTTGEGVFDLTDFSDDKYELAAYVYPVYCAYETVCNKKEGYLDLMDQLRAWKRVTDAEDHLRTAAAFLKMLMNTIEQMSPEIYEYYRELVDMFRTDVKKVLKAYYVEGCSVGCCFAENGVVDETSTGMLQEAIKKACEQGVLLTEKYQQYYC